MRFRESCRLARVPLHKDGELRDQAEQLVAHNAALLDASQDLALVCFATPGPIGYYLGETNTGPPTLGMHTFPLPFTRYRRLFEDGARLVIPPVRHVDPASVSPHIKMRSRLFWWIAEQAAHDSDPLASALLLDAYGFVTETAAANLLLVKDGRILTPWRGRVLHGISLQVVREICAERAIPFDEADLALDDCRRADEAILTNTSYCLAPVRTIQGRTLSCPGPMFELLLAAWNERVGLDVRAQITSS